MTRFNPGKYNCIGCGKTHTGYMVKKEVWQFAHLEPRDLCCMSCLTKRIGRPLTIADLADVPLNYTVLEVLEAFA